MCGVLREWWEEEGERGARPLDVRGWPARVRDGDRGVDAGGGLDLILAQGWPPRRRALNPRTGQLGAFQAVQYYDYGATGAAKKAAQVPQLLAPTGESGE